MIACADVLHLPLPDASVDLVMCSPPYEDSRTYGIDFKIKGQQWVDWAVAGFVECLRVSRGLVAWVVGHGKRRDFQWSATPALMMADLHRRGVILRDPVWFHRVGIPGSGGPDWLRQDVETVVCATAKPGRLPWSSNTACGHPPTWGLGGKMSYRHTDGTRCNQWGGGKLSTGGERARDGSIRPAGRPSHIIAAKNELGIRTDTAIGTRRTGAKDPDAETYRARFREDKAGNVKGGHDRNICILANPGSVVKCKVGGGLMGHRLAHENEAPYPLALAEFFIRSFCPPDGMVLDPFSGSGTTAHAATAWGRKFIALDLRPSQCDLTRRRLQDVQMELIA